MTKADIVSEISKSTGIEKLVVQTIVESSMDSIRKSLIRVYWKTFYPLLYKGIIIIFALVSAYIYGKRIKKACI